jgi:hypothetical protein
LPTGGDLPEALRRSEDTAAIGYSGRKRGDVQFRRATLQHSGTESMGGYRSSRPVVRHAFLLSHG